MRKAFVRLVAVLAAIVMMMAGFAYGAPMALATDTQQVVEPDVKYIAPTLSSDAPAYDETHPENLTEDQLYAKSAILIEASTGEVIFEKNADQSMYPASTTKIMTAYLGLTMGDMNATVTMDDISANIPSDSSTIPLSIGETINFQDLI